jgi:hypothetical protein
MAQTHAFADLVADDVAASVLRVVVKVIPSVEPDLRSVAPAFVTITASGPVASAAVDPTRQAGRLCTCSR